MTESPSSIECIHYCTGKPIDRIEYLFKTFEMQGLLMQMDILQLAEIGIPVFKLFADHFGCEKELIRPMSRDHVIRYSDFLSVIENLTFPGGLMYMKEKPKFYK